MTDMIVVNTDFSEVEKVFEMRASGFPAVSAQESRDEWLARVEICLAAMKAEPSTTNAIALRDAAEEVLESQLWIFEGAEVAALAKEMSP